MAVVAYQNRNIKGAKLKSKQNFGLGLWQKFRMTPFLVFVFLYWSRKDLSSCLFSLVRFHNFLKRSLNVVSADKRGTSCARQNT